MNHPGSSPRRHERGIFRFELQGEDDVLYNIYDFEGEKVAVVRFASWIDESITDECAHLILEQAEAVRRRLHWRPRLHQG